MGRPGTTSSSHIGNVIRCRAGTRPRTPVVQPSCLDWPDSEIPGEEALARAQCLHAPRQCAPMIGRTPSVRRLTHDLPPATVPLAGSPLLPLPLYNHGFFLGPVGTHHPGCVWCAPCATVIQILHSQLRLTTLSLDLRKSLTPAMPLLLLVYVSVQPETFTASRLFLFPSCVR